jgi:D-galactonate transporter
MTRLEIPQRAVNESAVVTRVMWRLIPLAIVLYVLNYLDRVNVSFAKLEMNRELGLNDAIYGFGASIFFIGYFLFEVPSNLIMQRVGARIWIARIMISWGAISAAMMLVRGPKSFYALRFLLGLAEAGFFPGIILYFTYWIPRAQRARAGAWFLTSIALSGVIGGPIAGALLSLRALNLSGWQWLFLLEGIPTIVLGFVVLFALPNSPDEAKWLSDDEKIVLKTRIAVEQLEQHPESHRIRFAMRNPMVWLFSLLYALIIFGFYVLNYWIPSIIKDASQSSSVIIGLLSAIPFACATIGMVVIGYISDHTGAHRTLVMICSLIGAAGLTGCALSRTSTSSIVSLSIAAVGIFGSLAPFWAMPPAMLRGAAAATGIATINSIGNLAGFASNNTIGPLKERTHSYTQGLLLSAGVCVAATILCVGMSLWPKRAVDLAPSSSGSGLG